MVFNMVFAVLSYKKFTNHPKKSTSTKKTRTSNAPHTTDVAHLQLSGAASLHARSASLCRSLSQSLTSKAHTTSTIAFTPAQRTDDVRIHHTTSCEYTHHLAVTPEGLLSMLRG